MFRSRKPKPSADTSIPTSPTDLKNLASQRNSRALAATSTAIALSLGSALPDIRDTPSDYAAVRGRYTGWKTAYGAARMAVEIAKESSDAFPPLKAVVGAVSVLISNYDQTSDNAEGVKEVERRVQSLSGALASPVSEDDYPEKGRRLELQRKLEGVIAKLEPLSDQHALVGFLRNADNAKTLTGFVQELADAITDYQVSVQQGVYERTRIIRDDTKNILEAADLEILAKLEPVHDAGYQAGHHDKCLPGTRESVLRDITFWARNPRDQNVFWLNGLAGTGKSTIAQSFSNIVASEGILGASFFCSRDYLNRRELKNIFPTLAHQLACHYPHFRSHVVSTIKKDPTLAHASLISQLENLLVNPLSKAEVACVIVIDALDECIDNQPASAVLSVLGRFAKQLPLVKIFITGRPEPRIRTGFRLPLLEPLTQIFLLHGVELSSVDNDIRLYLTQRLTTIAKQRSDLELPNPWPRDYEINALTEKSSGLFIFASTLARFIESEHHAPNKRLQLVLSNSSGTTHEGCAGIDLLYSQVLLCASSDVNDPELFANMKLVLGAIILAFNPLSRRELSGILDISTTLISTTLRHLHSIILIPADECKEIRVFHKSFPDFLQDEKRCANPQFYIDPVVHHGGMVLSCLELVKKLKSNPCSLPSFVMNQDIPNLPQLLEDRLGCAVQYACRYWARHLGLSPKSGDYVHQVTISVTEVLKNPLPWIEVMSLENCLEEGIHSMHSVLDWLVKVIPFIQSEVNTTQHNADAAKHKADAAQHKAETAQHKANTTKWKADTAQHKANAAQQKANAAHHDATTAATQCQAAIAQHKAIMTLQSLALDCLRLLMHFFHPIQQCAQQVYCSALPLSPISSPLRSSCLQMVISNQLSCITAFSGAPNTWGLLLRTIDVRPRQLTCIATSFRRIIAACGDFVNIYDAVTFVLQQSLSTPEAVVKIQGSPDGAILFFAHSFSVTMWDVQTGGLIHTFTTKSEISNIAVSTVGDYIACGLSNGSVAFWDIHTKEEGKGFGDGQSVMTIYWISPVELVVATQRSLYIHNITIGKTPDGFSIPDQVWGMVYLGDEGKFLVGTSQLGLGVDQGRCFLTTVESKQVCASGLQESDPPLRRSPVYIGQLSSPILVGDEIACITPPSGVQSFNTRSYRWTNNPPLLDTATSMAISLNRNLVVQTKDTIQIFSIDVITSEKTREDTYSSHIYPLGEQYIICILQPNRNLALLELETLQELHPDDNSSPLGSLLTDWSPSAHTLFGCGLVAEFGISVVTQAWKSGTPLPEWIEAVDEDVPLSGLSPKCTRVATIYGSPRWELRVKDAKDGTILASLPTDHYDGSGIGEVYDLAFDSETRFHLKVGGAGRNVQIPHDIIPSPSGRYSNTITKGEPVPSSEPRTTPPYSLDTACEWVLDAESRRVCWISPGNVRRGNGGHFWAGLSLVMVGDDGVVRKLSFKEPDC